VQLAKFYSNIQGDFQGIATKAGEFNECLCLSNPVRPEYDGTVKLLD
jgi:hypothetical protein